MISGKIFELFFSFLFTYQPNRIDARREEKRNYKKLESGNRVCNARVLFEKQEKRNLGF